MAGSGEEWRSDGKEGGLCLSASQLLLGSTVSDQVLTAIPNVCGREPGRLSECVSVRVKTRETGGEKRVARRQLTGLVSDEFCDEFQKWT